MNQNEYEISKKAVDHELKVVKARFWVFIGYAESLPTDWIHQLQITGLQFAISPLHDKDINPDGTVKKPHYHIILAYNGPTTYSNVKKTITDPLGQPHPQFLSAIKGYYRYLTHKDNPEKAQYSDSDIRCFGGFDPSDFFSPTSSDEDRLYNAIEDFIIEYDIKEYFDCICFLKLKSELEMLSFIRRHSYHFKQFIESNRYRSDKIDFSTGELKPGGIV